MRERERESETGTAIEIVEKYIPSILRTDYRSNKK